LPMSIVMKAPRRSRPSLASSVFIESGQLRRCRDYRQREASQRGRGSPLAGWFAVEVLGSANGAGERTPPDFVGDKLTGSAMGGIVASSQASHGECCLVRGGHRDASHAERRHQVDSPFRQSRGLSVLRLASSEVPVVRNTLQAQRALSKMWLSRTASSAVALSEEQDWPFH
jgi:hypothetical protein